MNQFNNPQQPSVLTADILLKDVYSIIDSRIQYIEYQAHCRLKHSISDGGHSTSDHAPNAGPRSTSDMLANNFDKMMHFVNGLTMPLKLLQILKSWLREDNVSLIMTLLYNNNYLQYSEDHLEELLKKEYVQSIA